MSQTPGVLKPNLFILGNSPWITYWMMLSVSFIASGWLVGPLAVSAQLYSRKKGRCKLRKETGREDED